MFSPQDYLALLNHGSRADEYCAADKWLAEQFSMNRRLEAEFNVAKVELAAKLA